MMLRSDWVRRSLLVGWDVSFVSIRMPSLASVLVLALAIAVSLDWRHGGTEVHDRQILGRKLSGESTNDAMGDLAPG